jgi:hypothetical protein
MTATLSGQMILSEQLLRKLNTANAGSRSFFHALRIIALVLALFCFLSAAAWPKTSHKVYFKGTDVELDVYMIHGAQPGPTIMILGGIQGDEPGGYLAADLYADISLRKGNLIVAPRANLVSIVRNERGVRGDMNRKFADKAAHADRDARVVSVIKGLMEQCDLFLNLHDGSGFYSPTWKGPLRNPMRYGQSIIADTDLYIREDGRKIELAKMAKKVISKVNPQIEKTSRLFRFNNHQTQKKNSLHKEQRLSATFHALTKVGIPAFGIETSKEIEDFQVRVRHQTMIINAFMEEMGIIPDNPRIYLDNPYLKYMIVSINGRTPIVVKGHDTLELAKGDRIQIVHIESNYSRGLIARVRGAGGRFNDINKEIPITADTEVEVRKDRFLIARIPVKVSSPTSFNTSGGVHFEPKVRYFRIRVNSKTYTLAPGEELRLVEGARLAILDPNTNLPPHARKRLRIDLRGFQAVDSPYPYEDRGHHIDTIKDLQKKYGSVRGDSIVYAIQAKLSKRVLAASYIVVERPKLDYLVLSGPGVAGFVAGPGDRVEIPSNEIVRIYDIRTNLDRTSTLFMTMAGDTVRWAREEASGLKGANLPKKPVPMDITHRGRSLGRIWISQGDRFRVYSSDPGRGGPVTVSFDQ